MSHSLQTFEEEAVEVSISGNSGLLVLAVDDEAPILMLAKMMLLDQGFRVIAVENPLEALAIYTKMSAEIDFVLLDFAMPENGWGGAF